MNDSVLWVLLVNVIHKGCLPRLTYVHRLHILLYCTFLRSSAMLLVDVICISLASRRALYCQLCLVVVFTT